MSKYTIATPANRNDLVLYGDASVKMNAPVYPCRRDAEGYVRIDVLDEMQTATQDIDESISWLKQSDAQEAADAMNRKFNDVGFTVVKL